MGFIVIVLAIIFGGLAALRPCLAAPHTLGLEIMQLASADQGIHSAFVFIVWCPARPILEIHPTCSQAKLWGIQTTSECTIFAFEPSSVFD